MSAPLSMLARAAAAAAAAAALGAAALAAPAAAQAPEPVEVFAEDYSPIAVGGTPELFGLRIAFGEDFAEGEHTVTAEVAIDAPDGTFTIGLDDGSGTDCPVNEAGTVLSCAREEAEAATWWEFRYAPAQDAEPGVYPYTVTFAVDGETVAVVEDDIEVLPEGQAPFLHAEDAFAAAPGDTVEVRPEYLQDRALPPGTAALAFGFTDPGYLLADLADPGAAYDNCVDGYWGGSDGVTCVVTDFEDLPGTVFAPTAPIGYAIDAAAPGPLDVCGCSFLVRPLDATRLLDEYGELSWDEDSGDLFAVASVDSPQHSEFPYSSGRLTITTADNPYDLSVADANVKAAEGTEATVPVTVANGGPAWAHEIFDGPGSYALLGTLPTGTTLVDLGGEHWACLAEEDWEHHLPGADPEALAKLDFVCFFAGLGAGESLELSVRVSVTGTGAKSDGTLAVIALEKDGYPGIADRDPGNNTAVLSVGAGGGGRLPTTGSPLAAVFGAAAAALAAGALLFALARRHGVPLTR